MQVFSSSFSLFCNFYRLNLHNETCVALASISASWIQNQTFFDLIVVIGSVGLVIIKLDTSVIPIVLNTESKVVKKICRRSLISFKHVSLWYLIIDPP